MAVETDVRGGRQPEPVFFRPAGGAPPVPIQGLEGFLTTMAGAVQELSNIRRDLTIMVKRGEAQNTVQDALTRAIERHAALLEQQIRLGRSETGVSSGQAISTSIMGDGGAAAPPPSSSLRTDWTGWDTYRETRDFFRGDRGFSLGSLRQRMGQALEQRLQNWQFPGTPPIVQNRAGQWIDAETGRFVPRSTVDQFRRRETIAGALRGGAQTLARGGALRQAAANTLGMLPGGTALLRGAGVVGAGLYAANKIGDFFESQRAQNAEWQRIMGGTNLEAVGERWNQRMFALGQFGVLDSEQASQLYRGVAETGLRGADRTTAQDFALDAYKQLGMTIQESMQIIKVAARTGQESLYGVAGALRQVTEDAKEAGINAAEARQRFIQTWTDVSNFLGGGPTAVATSLGLSRAITGMGRAYQGAVVGGIGQSDLRLLAARRGMSTNELLLKSLDDPFFLADAIGTDARQEIIKRMKPGGLDRLREAAANLPEGPLSEGDRMRLARIMIESTADFMGTVEAVDPLSPGINLASMPLDAQAAFLAEVALGRFNPGQEARQAQESMAAYEVEGAQARARAGQGTLAGTQTRSGETLGDIAKSSPGRIRRAWIEGVGTTGKAGGISEAIVRDALLSRGIQKVEIEGQVMTLERALREFQADINKGEAEIVAGASDLVGRTVGEVTGYGRGGVTGEQGSVVIGLTPEAKRALNMEQIRGKVRYDENWAPGDPHLAPSEFATGR